jgi:putative transposase
VQDLFSRLIAGWAMAGHTRQELVVDALEMAISRRRPPKGTIHHSDHGGQFIGLTFGQTCHDAGIASRWAPSERVTTTRSRRRSSRP